MRCALRMMRGAVERAGAGASGDPPPPCTVKLGTTVATNALLERRGARTLLVTPPGLGDLLKIGTNWFKYVDEVTAAVQTTRVLLDDG